MPRIAKSIKMFDESMEGFKVTIGGNEVKVLVWIQNRKSNLD